MFHFYFSLLVTTRAIKSSNKTFLRRTVRRRRRTIGRRPLACSPDVDALQAACVSIVKYA